MSDNENLGLETLAVRAGQQRTQEGEHSEPIFMTSSYVFANAAEAAARFSGKEPGNVYSRFTNPTVRTFEQRLAALEGGERCVATASGMAAILSVAMSLLKTGDHILTSSNLFGSTVLLFKNILGRFGVESTFVQNSDVADWEQAIQSNTRLLFIETPANPLTDVFDIQQLAELAHCKDCLLVVDNCFCTPILQRPLALGADIVVHSATKFLDGQGRCVGGAVVGSEELVGKEVYTFLRSAGPSMSPFNAWVFLKGLETLPLRIKAQSEQALQLAQWLEQQEKVARVYYPGLSSHPQHTLAMQQQSAGGAIVAFEVAGGQKQAWTVIDQTKLLSITANLGDTRTTITHPATTTHGRLQAEERAQAGIQDNLIRLAVGLETLGDIKSDLQRGLDACH